MSDYSPFIAANKFGLGLQPGELVEISPDPRGWLLAQLEHPNVLPPRYQDMPGSASLITSAAAEVRNRQQILQNGTPDSNVNAMLRQSYRGFNYIQQQLLNQRLAVAIETDQPFTERLVRFWSNHFTIAIEDNKQQIAFAGVAYENECIRRHMTGRFEDMLLAVVSHPCMLIYLDNAASIGPNSQAGRNSRFGKNENLAREILELHTLGVDGGYTQNDVSELALMLTGWSVNLPPQNGILPSTAVESGAFLYRDNRHEPGSRQLLGRTYAATGRLQAESALRDLAAHPSTAQFVAWKLARHFIADEPPESAVEHLAQVFRSTNGDLPSLHRALVEMDESWSPAYKKLKTAEDFVVSTVRAMPQIGLTDEVLNIISPLLNSFNQRPFTAPSPAGWPEEADHWGGPDALLKRIEFANQVGLAVGLDFDALDMAMQILPDDLSLQLAVQRAESRIQALTLLFGSSQFQWRA